jgi:hypothetical protein
MLYAAIWRSLPGPTVVRLMLALLLLLAVVAFCFLWLFPRIAPLMPFNDNTVDHGPSGAASAYHRVVAGPAATEVRS